jgi:chemotaxis protein methyltransferase CheR
MGRLEDAKGCCQQAIDKNPLMAEGHYILALIHQEENDPTEAIAILKKALYLEPNFVLAHFNLSVLYEKLIQGEKAARHREKAITLAERMSPDDILPGSDDLTARQLLTMIKATIQVAS